MELIKIIKENKIDDGWEFIVQIGDSENYQYKVHLNEEYYKKLTDEEIKPGQLIEKSFQFLLEREPKTSILKEFNLEIINKYFPEYEENIYSSKN
ncbi:MAG: hypothetical protein WDZ80_02785 [Candidatus Paceibacterota bacterium]